MSLVLAVGRGRVLESVQSHLRELGMPLPQAGQISATSGERTLLVVRSWDVPTFVSEGAADIGITAPTSCARTTTWTCTSRWTWTPTTAGW